MNTEVFIQLKTVGMQNLGQVQSNIFGKNTVKHHENKNI